MTQEQAIDKAREWLNSVQIVGNELELILEETISKPYGWFFFYDSITFRKTNNLDFALAGNAPILIDKTGFIHFTGSAYDIDYYIEKYDKLFS